MSERQYTLYGGPSNRGLRALWCLEELELTYHMIDLQLFQGEQRAPDYLKLNPAGKVPSLIDHGALDERGEPLVVTESVAVLNYLAEKYSAGDEPLIPSTLIGHARYHQWMSFGATELEPPLWVYAKQTHIYPEARRVPAITRTCVFEFQRAVKQLSGALSDERPFILGDRFSAADIFIGQTLMWAQDRGVELPEGPALAYLTRLKGRPALQRALAQDARA